MFYEVSKEIFDRMPDAVFGVVAARGLDNKRTVPTIQKMLEDKDMPLVNPIVDLGNALSFKYNLPIRAHDIYSFVRPDGSGRGTEDAGLELGLSIWKQNEKGKITEDTTGVLFSIEAASINKDAVEKAMKDFVELIANYYARSGHCVSVETGLIDKDNRRFEF